MTEYPPSLSLDSCVAKGGVIFHCPSIAEQRFWRDGPSGICCANANNETDKCVGHHSIADGLEIVSDCTSNQNSPQETEEQSSHFDSRLVDSDHEHLSGNNELKLKFHPLVFCEQLVIQTLIPLSSPFVWYAYGSGAVSNLILWPSWDRKLPFFIFWLQTFHITAWMLSVYGWFSTPAYESKTRGMSFASTLGADVMSTAILFFFHRMSVALKYAYMDPVLYKRFMGDRIPEAERFQEMLLGGWICIPPALLEREVARCLNECDCVDNEQCSAIVVTSHQLLRLTKFLGPEACQQLGVADTNFVIDNGTTNLKAGNLASAIMIQANKATLRWTHIITGGTVLLGMVMFMTPLTLRAIFGLPLMGTTMRDTIVISAHYLGGPFWFPVVLTFLSVAAVDGIRRARALDLLGKLIMDPGTHLNGEPRKKRAVCSLLPKRRVWPWKSLKPSLVNGGDAVAGPIINLDSVQQIEGWLMVRYVLLHVGERFRARAIAMVSLGVILFAIIAAVFVVILFAFETDMETMIIQLVLLQVATIPPFALASAGLQANSDVNQTALTHASLMVKERVAARIAEVNKCNFLDVDEAKPGPANMADLLEGVEGMIVAESREDPVRILGFQACPELTQSFLGAWLSFQAAVLSVATSRLLGKSS